MDNPFQLLSIIKQNLVDCYAVDVWPPGGVYSQTWTWRVLNFWHTDLLLLSLLRDCVMLLRFSHFLTRHGLYSASLSSHSSRTDQRSPGPSLDGQSGVFGQCAKEAPVFKMEPEGADWQHPAAMSRGSMGKMVRSEKEFELSWLLGWWAHPAAAALTQKKKTFQHFPPSLHFIPGKNCARNWMNRVEVAREGERGSWRCHRCLREAVVGSTSYLLWAHAVITLTTQRIRLSVQTHPPPPPRFFHAPTLLLTDDPNIPALTRFTMQACYSSRLQIGRVLPPVQLLWNVRGEPTVARCIHQLSTDGRVEFLKNSEPRKTWNWITTFERFQKLNEKHRGVIVKTNKQFFGAAETDVSSQPPKMQRDGGAQGWKSSASSLRMVCFLLM